MKKTVKKPDKKKLDKKPVVAKKAVKQADPLPKKEPISLKTNKSSFKLDENKTLTAEGWKRLVLAKKILI